MRQMILLEYRDIKSLLHGEPLILSVAGQAVTVSYDRRRPSGESRDVYATPPPRGKKFRAVCQACHRPFFGKTLRSARQARQMHMGRTHKRTILTRHEVKRRKKVAR